jgi:tripartite-type tricarboxylate transporter receptor subunit TctC
MQRRSFVSCGLAAGVLIAAAGPSADSAIAQWKPDKPVTIVVPWAAGGSTDQVVRVVGQELEKALGQKVVIVNQPGASGSIGTKSVFEGPRDGTLIASGAAKDLGTYAVSGLLNTRLDDWHLYLAVVNASVVGVNAKTPYQTLDDLIKAMKERPNQVTVATAGITSSGGGGLRQLMDAFKVEAKHITYDGGNPAVIATAGGETEATTQLGVEQAEMLRAKRLRGLAVLAGRPLVLEGIPPIPPITKFKADFVLADNYFGIFVRKGVPKTVTDTLDKIWRETMPKSKALADYAGGRGAIAAVLYGEDARKAVMPAIQVMAYGLVARNQAKIDPATVGIPKP